MMVANLILFVTVMAMLVLLREAIHFVTCYTTLSEYKISRARLILLWLSLSYVITVIISCMI